MHRPRLVVLLPALLLLGLVGCNNTNNETTGVSKPQSTVERVGGAAPSPPALAPASASPGISASPGVSASPSPSGGAPSGAAPSGAGSFSVNMSNDLKYDPVSLTVRVGSTITWHNSSMIPHTVTADPSKVADKAHVALPEGVDPWDSGNMDPGASYSYTFTKPGTYEYVCLPHEAAGMLGTIVVQP